MAVDGEDVTTEALLSAAFRKLVKEIDEIITHAREVNKKLARAKILLTATSDLLELQKDSEEVLNLLEELVQYDDDDCKGYRLHEDIQELIESMK